MTPGARLRVGVAALCAGLVFAAPAPADEPRLQFDADGSVAVRGLAGTMLELLRGVDPGDPDWRRAFPVHTGHEPPPPASGRPTVLGRYEVLAGGVRFTPRFPLVPGQTYHAAWHGWPPGEAVRAELRFGVERVEEVATTVVARVDPTVAEVPENLLKLYLTFSAPMSRGEAARHVHLLDAEGQEIPAPFVAPQHELWNAATDRLTLFFDPGRTKRGVGPHEELGPALREGRAYRLVIDRAWRDARGNPLREPYERTLRVVAPDRSRPRTDEWELVPPATPADAVALHFPESLDRALLLRLLVVQDAEGRDVRGVSTTAEAETRWVFTPLAPWPPGAYSIRVGTELEDLAGNSLRRRFETLPGEEQEPAPETIALPFEIRPEP